MKTDFDTAAGPHAPTEKFLQELGLWFAQQSCGLYVVIGDITLSNKKMTRLPDLSRIHLEGSLFCDNCGLETMEGSPAIVTGRILCRHNKLKDFMGISKHIGLPGLRGGVCAEGNALVSLRGLPENMGPTFYCENNPGLVSLFGLPKTVTDLRTPFGNFTSYAQIPADLLRDLESERLREEARAKCSAAQEAITLDAPPIIAAARKIRL
jgi:hypothetical protein